MMDFKNVLIVEDELLIAYSLKDMLGSKYNVCDIVMNYNDGVKAIETQRVDIVLLDVNLAGPKTGMDLAVLLNRLSIPYIFITALTHEDMLNKMLAHKPSAYLSKPISKADLNSAMHLALTNYEIRADDYIEICIGKQRHRFAIDRIFYVRAEHIYCKVVMDNESVVLRISLSKVIEKAHDRLRRINRQVAVNPKLIKSETSSKITLFNGMKFIKSKRY